MSAEIEAAGNANPEKCAVILLDIAGTTTSSSFIQDTLFPFAVANAEEYLKSHWDEEVVKDAVKQLNEYNENISVSEVAEIIKTAPEKGEVDKGVKTLQGLVYRQGYEDGKLKAPVFPDVASSLESWSKNHRVAIYSSGSIEAQKLLFGHTTEGDLSASIAQYFDLSVGSKAEASSYEKIAKELAVAPEEIIYINDDIEEAKAASQAGIRSILINREDADTLDEKLKEFKIIRSFSDLSVEISGKRKIEEKETPEEPPTKIAKTEEDKVVVRKADEEQKNINAEEEPMEIDSTNEIKDDKAGDSKLESDGNKDENTMEIDVTVNAENEKTEAKTDQRDDALNETTEKGEGKMMGDVKKTNNEKEFNLNVITTKSKDNMDSKDINTKAKVINSDVKQENAGDKPDTSVQDKSAVNTESHQTNSDSVEKFEGFSEKNTNDSNEILADSTEKLTDSGDKTDNTSTTDSPPTEMISPVLEKDCSITVSTSTGTGSNTEEITVKENDKVDSVCIAEINDSTKSNICEKLKEGENNMEDITEEKNEVDVIQTECKTSEAEKDAEKNNSVESSVTDSKEMVTSCEEATVLPSVKDEIDVIVSETDVAGNEDTNSELIDKEMESLSTGTETKTANEETGDALMELCETTVEDKVKEQDNANDIKEAHNECKNICNKENSDSNKVKSVHTKDEEIDAAKQGDDADSSTTNIDTSVQKQECTSSEVSNACEKEEEEAGSAEDRSTEKNVVECEMKEIENTEDKVNGNEAESSRSDEKENKSELANGTTSVETGSDVNENGDVENAPEEEIKVKKLEENPDSTATVSVEA